MIEILGRNKLIERLEAEPDSHAAIVIYEPDEYYEVEMLEGKGDLLFVSFWDVTSESINLSRKIEAPTLQDVLYVLEWSKTRDVSIVACHAGISRSSAIAYLIECQKTTPEKAAEVWNIEKHIPNELILKHGVSILGEHIVPPIKQYYEKIAARKGWQLKWVTKFFL